MNRALFIMKPSAILLVPLLILGTGCETTSTRPEASTISKRTVPSAPKIDRDTYHDKVLGLLIGSAIGDAMGAPTEMWSRDDIQFDYGFVGGLDDMVRTPSAEGTWKNNLPAGGTTDDTRWKALTIDFLLSQKPGQESAADFAEFIVARYEQRIANLKSTEGFHPQPYEDALMKMAWLQEWALVAKPYLEDDLPAYSEALAKFYGGEMTCAGMLYSPMLAAAHPGRPEAAYQLAYNLGFFDLGYARDMTGLIAAMTAAAFEIEAHYVGHKARPTSQAINPGRSGLMPDSESHSGSQPYDAILDTNRSIDPEGYFASRLIGRTAFRTYQHARRIVADARAVELDPEAEPIEIPVAFSQLDSLTYVRLKRAFDLLDEANQDIAFHPAEIYLITLTAMMYHDFEFTPTMSFITNYGRDNDTVAAIAGAILGAYWGAEKLPPEMSEQVLRVNREELDIDLMSLATQITAHQFSL
ncbi:MAG: hypothetical protein SynsKO_32980 [Synoicihabitans sp.]